MKTGKIVALEVDHYSNVGNSQDLSLGVCRTCPCIRGDWEVTGVPHSLFAHAGIGLLNSCLLLQ